MVELTTYSISLPVHLAIERDGNLVQGQMPVGGTCFPIGGEFFLTAGHVVTELEHARSSSRGIPAVGIFEPSTYAQNGIPIVDMEHLDSDLGLIKVEYTTSSQESWIFPLHWTKEQVVLGLFVRTPGYAYADHNVNNERYIVQRSFQGNIVSSIGRYLPLGMTAEPFSVYELSFAAPRGHSGSPLLREDGRVVGLVIGNSKSRMLILDSEEVSVDGKTTTLVEQYESLTLGVAVQNACILGKRSLLLGMTIQEYLSRRRLVH